MKYVIYGLVARGSKEVRYVGCTRQKPEYRLMQHISSADGRAKRAWIDSLEEDPELIVLDRARSPEAARKKERRWIRKLPNLTNCQQEPFVPEPGAKLTPDGYRSVRLQESTHVAVEKLQALLCNVGLDAACALVPIRGTTISDVVSFASRVAEKLVHDAAKARN
jgi:hypothetical protein